MSWKQSLRLAVERVTGRRILRVLPRGLDVFWDIRNALPRYTPELILDVGANVGQSASEFARWAPRATIHCFEPVRQTFEALTRNTQQLAGVRCHALALGSRSRRARMVLEGGSVSFRLGIEGEGQEEVQVGTLGEFCERERIAKVSYLKIDTEGHDLEVLKGGAALLDAQAVDIVQVEAGMNAGNTLHVPFEHFRSYLNERGYALFGVYEQMEEWPTEEPQLRRSNLVFISLPLAHANRGAARKY